MSEAIIFRQVSDLEKVFLNDDIARFDEYDGKKALKGERISYQIAFTGGEERKTTVEFSINSDLPINVRMVGNVPCAMPAYKDDCDEYYLSTESGLFPDVLYPIDNYSFEVMKYSAHSLFVTVEIPKDTKTGTYPIEIVFSAKKQVYKTVFSVQVLDECIPEQKTIYTQWLHTDCIASYYNLEMFSEEHWEMIEKFIKKAVYCGINMILTPVFTPPLDTEVGRERPTVQLADVYYNIGVYKFGFGKLKRWIDMCKKNGIKKFEISHLFSQWGTGCAPKIVAETENGTEKIFGWHTKADSAEYRTFLKSFLPELTEFLKSENVYDDTLFHVSDEPDFVRDFECYKMEREILTEFIPEDKIIDAISHCEFCECGLVKKPIVVVNAIDRFFEKGITDIWAYYCCGPASGGYTNRGIAMPSGRNRICGMMLYKYGIEGFLHWGYNFYYSQLSKRKINPFLVTDSDEAFISGDAFSVYPGEDGPLDSLRSEVFYSGLQDIRACKLLEGYIGKSEVDKIIEENGARKFNEFPRENSGIENIRNRINDKLEELISCCGKQR